MSAVSGQNVVIGVLIGIVSAIVTIFGLAVVWSL